MKSIAVLFFRNKTRHIHHKIKMFKVLTIFASCLALTFAQEIADATAQCIDLTNPQNNRDFYADSEDCHGYVQCFFVNETFAVGHRRQCPSGSFWRQEVLSCLPEGDAPCVDQCRTSAIATKGCYAGLTCSQFFVCSNTASYAMCCPTGSKFVDSTCTCEIDETCDAACSQQGPALPTTVQPASQFNATVCQDSFGAYLSKVADEPNAFVQIDAEGQATDKMYCAVGSAFNFETCRCDIETDATIPPTQTDRRSVLYMNYQKTLDDLSRNHFYTPVFNGAYRDTVRSAIQPVGGVLGLPNTDSYQSVPGLKSYDFGSEFTWCAYFRCYLSYDLSTYPPCTESGHVLSNRNGNDFTFDFGFEATNHFVARLNFWQPESSVVLESQFTPNASNRAWSHFCVTYGDSVASLYLQGELAASQNVGGRLAISHNPTQIGGNYVGMADGITFLPFVIDADTIRDYNIRGVPAIAPYV